MKLFQPKNLVLLTIFCLPLYMVKVAFLSLPTNLLELLAVFSSAVVLFSQRKVIFERLKGLPKIYLAAIAFLLLGVISSIFSNDNWLAGLGILKGWFLIPILFSLSAYLVFNSAKDLEKAFRAIFFSAGLIALISLVYKSLQLVTYDDRLASFYLSPNHLAMYLAPGFIFGWHFAFEKKYHWRNLYLGVLLLISVSLYYTFSMGAWTAFAVSFLVISILRKRCSQKMFFAFLFAVSLLLTSQLGSEKIQNVLNNFSRSSLASRITIWKVSWRLISENPLLGIGPGNFQNSYLSLQPSYPPFLEWAVPQPHNIFLAFWLQAGIIGLLSFLVILWLTFQDLSLLLQKSKNAALAAPLMMFFFYTVIHGIIDTPYWKNDLAFLFWICLVLTISLKRLQRSLESK